MGRPPRRERAEALDDARGAMTHLADFNSGHTYFRYDEPGRRTVRQLPNGAVTYTGYDAASQTTSVFNRASNMDALPCVYYQYNDDGLPTKQAGTAGFSASGSMSRRSWWVDGGAHVREIPSGEGADAR
ncbi:MAG: hypothetical protein GF320_11265 [Armatimonadia bacterium]|nr:hypothetical protein [Armatimonadia bacterium]